MFKLITASIIALASILSLSGLQTSATTGYRMSPILECVIPRDVDGDSVVDLYTAVWGYNNTDPVAGNVQSIPAGNDNKFTGNLLNPTVTPITDFVSYMPYRAVNAFSTNFVSGNLVWSVKGGDGLTRTSTANPSSKVCGRTATATFPYDPTK
jgi:hypothetical protein